MKLNKLFAGVLAAAMMMSVGVSAMAANYTLDQNVYVPKTYEVNGGVAPAETFKFTFEGYSYKGYDDKETTYTKDLPSIDEVEIELTHDLKQTTKLQSELVDIDAGDYAKLGVYTYKVKETAGNTAGVTYDDKELYLVLTILRDETDGKHYVAAMHYATLDNTNKAEGFLNEYNAGMLSVTKQIKGDSANKGQKFDFTITFTAPKVTSDDNAETFKTVSSTIFVTKPDGTTEEIEFGGETKKEYTIQLGDSDTVTFENLPEGVTYVVSEDAQDYESSVNDENADGVINAGDEDAMIVTNTRDNGNVDTGVILDNAPYILMLAVVAGGVFFMVAKKRREE